MYAIRHPPESKPTTVRRADPYVGQREVSRRLTSADEFAARLPPSMV